MDDLNYRCDACRKMLYLLLITVRLVPQKVKVAYTRPQIVETRPVESLEWTARLPLVQALACPENGRTAMPLR